MGGRSRPSTREYHTSTPGAVRYVVVTLQGEDVGCLWAAVDGYAASFIRRLGGPEAAFRAPLTWARRLRATAAERLAPVEALRRWKGPAPVARSPAA